MSASWAWLTLTLIIAVFVTAFDLIAIANHARTMSGQMHLWLASPVVGPFAIGVLVAIPVGLIYHFMRI